MLYGVDALTCSICQNFSHKSKYTLQNHIESKHFPNTFVYTCPKCQKNVYTREALICHKKRCSSYWCWLFFFKVKSRSQRTSMCMWQEMKQLANHLAPCVKSSQITPWAMLETILKVNIFQTLSPTPVESVQQYLEPSMLLTCINEHIENMYSAIYSLNKSVKKPGFHLSHSRSCAIPWRPEAVHSDGRKGSFLRPLPLFLPSLTDQCASTHWVQTFP